MGSADKVLLIGLIGIGMALVYAISVGYAIPIEGGRDGCDAGGMEFDGFATIGVAE